MINGIGYSDNGRFIPIMEQLIPIYGVIYGGFSLYMGFNFHYQNTI